LATQILFICFFIDYVRGRRYPVNEDNSSTIYNLFLNELRPLCLSVLSESNNRPCDTISSSAAHAHKRLWREHLV